MPAGQAAGPESPAAQDGACHLPAVAQEHFPSFLIKAFRRAEPQVLPHHQFAFTFVPSLTAVPRTPVSATGSRRAPALLPAGGFATLASEIAPGYVS